MLDTPARPGRLCGILAIFAMPAFPQDRPDILWLVAEDMSPLLGSYGVAEARTPNLDRLARAVATVDDPSGLPPLLVKVCLLSGL